MSSPKGGKKVRLSVCPNSGKGRGKVQFVVVVTLSLDDIKHQSANKFKVKQKNKIRVYSTNNNDSFRAGTEITPQNVHLLFNDMLITVATKGEDFIFKDGRTSGATLSAQLKSAEEKNIPQPILFPVISNEGEVNDNNNDDIQTNNHDNSRNFVDNDDNNIDVKVESSNAVGLDEIELNGDFPILKGNVLESVRESIKASEVFFETKGEGYISFDYKSAFQLPPDTFLPLSSSIKKRERVIRAIRRECRGLLLCPISGEVIARRFHKFFNLNETDETKIADQTVPLGAEIYEKIDGSLVTPVCIRSISMTQLVWMTKNVVIDAVNKYTSQSYITSGSNYDEFSWNWIKRGCTPLFEWCDSTRVVGQISHDESSLILISIRHNISGEYVPRSEIEASAVQFHIPIVKQHSLEDIGLSSQSTFGDIVNHLDSQHNREGFVISYMNHHGNRCESTHSMMKLKTTWYVALASASRSSGLRGRNLLVEFLKIRPSILGVPPATIWTCVFDPSADDIFATATSILLRASKVPNSDNESENNIEENDHHLQVNYLQEFKTATSDAFYRLFNRLKEWSNQVQSVINADNESKDIIKAACTLASARNWPPQLAPLLLKGNYEQAMNELLVFVRKLIQKRKFEGLQSILGVIWRYPLSPLCEFPSESYDDLSSPRTNQQSEISNNNNRSTAVSGDEEKEVQLNDDGNDNETLEGMKEQFYVIDLGMFDKAIDRIVEFVLCKYFPRKMSNYLGISPSALLDSTQISIPRKYKAEEGKIKGMWEQFERDGIIDLRVDIQPPLSSGFTDHYGDHKYCHWQVQYGASKVCKTSSRAKKGCEKAGAFAAILIQTDRDFTFRHLVDALRVSFHYQRCVIVGDLPESWKDKVLYSYPEQESSLPLNLHNSNNSVDDLTLSSSSLPSSQNEDTRSSSGEWQIYCDLDGVLADFDKGIVTLTGKKPNEISSDYMWKRILASTDFFARLEPYDYTTQLWKELRDFSNKPPVILSGLPGTKYAKKAKKDKIEWSKKNLHQDVHVIACMSRDKHNYSGHHKILIDDRVVLRKDWESKGGIFIHHTSYDKTIWQLLRLKQPKRWNEPVLKCGLSLLRTVSENPAQALFRAKEVILVSGHVGEDKFVATLSNNELKVIGFDAEWRPDEMIPPNSKNKKSAISVIQIAVTSSCAFVVDMINATQTVIQLLHSLFTNQNILKVGYGIDQDLKRMTMICSSTFVLEPVLDLQIAIPLLLPVFSYVVEETENRNEDSQTIIEQHLNLNNNNRLTPLSYVVPKLLGMTINKSKLLQACDWEHRPLTNDQIEYAGTDAAVNLALFDQLCTLPILKLNLLYLKDSFIVSKTKGYCYSSLVEKSTTTTVKDSRKSIYSAVFLSEESKKQLLEHYPPRFSKIYGDHVTIAYLPTQSQIRSLPIGEKCEIIINDKDFYNDKVQCVPVIALNRLSSNNNNNADNWINECKDSRKLHITISTEGSIKPSLSNALLAQKPLPRPPIHPIKLEGTIAVMTQSSSKSAALPNSPNASEDPLGTLHKLVLPQRVIQQVTEFLKFAQVGEHLKFKPTDLSAAERFVLHEFAEACYSLSSRSDGKADRRRLTLTKQHQFTHDTEKSETVDDREDALENCDGEAVLSHSMLGELNGEEKTTDSNEEYDGIIRSDTIDIYDSLIPEKQQAIQALNRFTEETNKDEHIVVILRGLPGSGKSSVYKYLNTIANEKALTTAHISADLFFYNGAGKLNKRELKNMDREEIYKKVFNVSLLSQAHEWAHSQFLTAIEESANIVIVDNCNSQLWEFEFYLNEVKQYNKNSEIIYDVVVMEIICEDEKMLRMIHSRGLHGLSFSDLSRIKSKWEKYPPAILLRAYQPPSEIEKNGDNLYMPSGNTVTLQRWIEDHHCAHYRKGRRASHLSMATESRSSFFLDVSKSLSTEFWQVYAQDYQRNLPLHLMELCTPIVPMFFDVDFKSLKPFSHFEVVSFTRKIQSLVIQFVETNIEDEDINSHQVASEPINEAERFKVITTGFIPLQGNDEGEGKGKGKGKGDGELKNGFHLSFPSVILSLKAAKRCRDFCVNKLSEQNDFAIVPLTSWQSTFDDGVYALGRGLRMFGSRKVGNKGVDIGRVYKLLLVLNGIGEVDENLKENYLSDIPSLLRDISIRSE